MNTFIFGSFDHNQSVPVPARASSRASCAGVQRTRQECSGTVGQAFRLRKMILRGTQTTSTYGRREAVDERGVQPLEPRERCAFLKKPSASLERQKGRKGEMGARDDEKRRKQHPARLPLPNRKRDNPNNNSSSDSRCPAALRSARRTPT